jgi:hypothetical protein
VSRSKHRLVDSGAGPSGQVERLTLASWIDEACAGWDRFWFSAITPHTLAVIRIACGAMLAYIHVIWASQLKDFMGAKAWLDLATIQELHRTDWAWSWLFYVSSPAILWIHQLVAIAASFMMMAGILSRIAVPLAWWMTLMVCHRMTGALFGLDQIVVMLSMYLMLSQCGSVWSVDARLRQSWTSTKFSWLFPNGTPSVGNNIATRLIQLHLCTIYLFGGLGKMRGEMWWDGSALWYTLVNYEYQSLSLTWLGSFRFIIAALTAGTIFWETFYCALVWPRFTRPLVLMMAVFVHGGIAIALGMVTFGCIMIVANLAFVSPESVRQSFSRFLHKGSQNL